MGQATGKASLTRCLLVLLAATTGTVLVVALLLPDVVALGQALRYGAISAAAFDNVLVQVCEVAVAGCAAWLWLATAVTAADAVRGRRAGHRGGVPGAVRRLVLAACGVALVGGLGAPAHAGDRGGTSPVEGLPVPDRATTTQVSRVFARASAPQDRAHPVRRERAVVIVRPGDTLWAIARADLPPNADAGAVARRVHEIHQINRSVIGADPDLIRPDQRLLMPPPTTIREEHR